MARQIVNPKDKSSVLVFEINPDFVVDYIFARVCRCPICVALTLEWQIALGCLYEYVG